MALISCPECEKSISEFASSCPECGFPITKEVVEEIRLKEAEEAERMRLKKIQEEAEEAEEAERIRLEELQEYKRSERKKGVFVAITITFLIGWAIGMIIYPPKYDSTSVPSYSQSRDYELERGKAFVRALEEQSRKNEQEEANEFLRELGRSF